MKTIQSTAAAAAGILCFASAAQAASCDPAKNGNDLSFDEVQAVYDCFADELNAGDMTGNERWLPTGYVAEYRNWGLVTTLPANLELNGGRFLLTWVNSVGAEDSFKYKFAFESGSEDNWGKVSVGGVLETGLGSSAFFRADMASPFGDSIGYGLRAGLRLDF